MDLTVRPIGTVKNHVTDRKDTAWGKDVSDVILDEAYIGGLKGLEEFSHAIIVFLLDRACFDPEKHLRRRPQNRDDMPLTGIFAQRGKNRPNRIGITAVEILSVTEDCLAVRDWMPSTERRSWISNRIIPHMTERMRSFRNGWTVSWNTISDRENGTGADCGEDCNEKRSLSADGMGILICGLNGCGKSTLGRALADRLGYEFIDNEDLYFPKTDENYDFSLPRSREEAIRILETRIDRNSRFVFAAVKGDYGDKLIASLERIVLVEVPKEIRSRRVRDRSFRKFGERILPGGDLHDREEAWFALTDSRPEDYTEKWLETVRCPVIRIDGTLLVEENIRYLCDAIKR